MFGRNEVHLANRHRYLHEAAGRRFVFSVDERAVDIDQPEIPGEHERCPDCLDVAHRYETPTAEQTARRDAVKATVAELNEFLDEEQKSAEQRGENLVTWPSIGDSERILRAAQLPPAESEDQQDASDDDTPEPPTR
jgi:hypothetical protein